jgi:DNA repair protein SbcD/Mre11
LTKILHTADWHLGHTLRGYSRENEHAQVLSQIVTIIVEEEVDVLLVTGDIHDTQNPSGEAQQAFYRSLSRIRAARPAIVIVVISGNHDAPSRLEAPRALLSALNMHVIGSVRRKDGVALADRHLIPIRDSAGRHAVNILAVSHPTAGCLPNLIKLQDDSGSLVARKVGEMYDELYQQLRPQLEDLPFIVTGHLHVLGGDISITSERRILCGGEHAVPPTVFPPNASYVALGHLHKPQRVVQDHIRYSGSLFPMSATECDYKHSVTLVTVDENGVTSDRQIQLKRPVPFLRVPQTGAIAVSDLGLALSTLRLDSNLPVSLRPFVQPVLQRENVPAGFREELDSIGSSFPVRLLDPAFVSTSEAPHLESNLPDTYRDLSEQKPEGLFSLAFEEQFSRKPSLQHLDNFHWIESQLGVSQ